MTAVIVMGIKMGLAAGCFTLMGKAINWYHGEKEEKPFQGGLRDGRVPRNFPK